MKKDLLVIGGGPAGISAARFAKMTNPSLEVALIRTTPLAVIPCAIPYSLGETVPKDSIVIPDSMITGVGVDLIVDVVVEVKDRLAILQSGKKIEFDKLILATGSEPIAPPIAGADSENVFCVKDMRSLVRVEEALKYANSVVVVGGGFIGVEVGTELRRRGMDVSIVELLPHCLQTVFDEEFCEAAEFKMRSEGIRVCTRTTAVGIEDDRGIKRVHLDSGVDLLADVVIFGIGVRANTELASKMGITLGKFGVETDRYLQTNIEGVYAAGDCRSKINFITGKETPVKLASIAVWEGMTAASNAVSDRRREFPGVIGAFATKIFDLSLGMAGLNEEMAREEGIKYAVGTCEVYDKHPVTMPEASLLLLKLLFDSTSGVLIGAEARGGDSVGELINFLSFCMGKRMKVDDLIFLQHCSHPLLTPLPSSNPVMLAAKDAMMKM